MQEIDINSEKWLAYELLKTDFQKIYDVNLKASEERMHVMRLVISILSAPFIVIVALLTTKIIKPAEVIVFSKIPSFIFAFVLICGLANVIPLIRFIEVTGTHMRTARAINNFRKLYSILLTSDFTKFDWAPNLPTDSKYPPTYSVIGYAGINVAFIVFVNSLYITIGLFGYDNNNPISFSGFALFIIIASLQYALYPLKGKIKQRFNPAPENQFDFPEVEI